MQAAEEIRKARALLPALPALAVKEAEIQLDMGRPDAALLTARSGVELKQTYLRGHVALGMAYERKGDYESALARPQLEKINSTVRNCAFQVAVVYAGLGEDELALDWLETAWRTRQAHFPFAAVEYRLRRFHQNTRFRELLERVGLKPVS